MTKVWHAKKMGVGEFPADYEMVAVVETDSPDVAFELTNTIECPWWENAGVQAQKKTRSTSMGDVVEINGKFYLCEMIGWSEIK